MAPSTHTRPTTGSRRARAVVASAVGALVIPLAACSGGDDASGDSLTMWVRASMQPQAEAMVDGYNASHDTQIKLTSIPSDDFQGKVGAAAGSGDLPDLLAADVALVPSYASQKVFADLTSRIDALPFADDIAPSHVRAGTIDDAKYVVPFVMDISVFFYNKDLFRQAGLDPETPPATMAEVADAAKAVAALGDDVYGTAIPGACGGCTTFTWWPSVWAEGEQVMNEDGTQSLLDSETAKGLYAVYRDLAQTPGVVTPGSKDESGATWTAAFGEGNVGIAPMASTSFRTVPDTVDFGVAPIPGLTGGRSTYVGGDALGISASSKNADAAWDFIEWMLGDEAQVEIMAKGGDIPARTDLADNKYSAKDPRVVLINEVAADGVTPFTTRYGQAFIDPNGPWLVLQRDALYGDETKVDADNDRIDAALAD